MNVLEGKPVANKIKEELKSQLSTLNYQLKLAIVLVGEDPASVIYTDRKKKFGEEIGVEVEIVKLDPNISEEELAVQIKRLNDDPTATGIIIQLPLPSSFHAGKFLDLVDPHKDVDGLNSTNQASNEPQFYPAGALAVMEILQFYDIDPAGKKIAVIGQSDLAGKPIAKLLKKVGARVEVADINTTDTNEITIDSDIVISAVGKPGLIQGDHVREGVVLIDVGTTLVGDKLKGDIDQSAIDKSSAYTPVPGGVGPVTVACLFKNLLAGSS